MVPTLQIDGQNLTESMPIAEYLEETRPDIKLLPEDPLKKFEVRRLCEVISFTF